jgi:hypothetical protein
MEEELILFLLLNKGMMEKSTAINGFFKESVNI